MPMFEGESFGTVKLTECKTTSQTLLRASGGVDNLTAERCETGFTEIPSNPRWYRTVLKYCFNTFTAVAVGAIGSLLAALAAVYFHLP